MIVHLSTIAFLGIARALEKKLLKKKTFAVGTEWRIPLRILLNATIFISITVSFLKSWRMKAGFWGRNIFF